jgi:hypothetical protein
MGLFVGVRAQATDPARKMVVSARELGADAVLLGPHNVQKDAPLLEYYRQVSDAARIPCIIHDYPAVTGITLSVELITRIVAVSENISYIKLEDPHSMRSLLLLHICLLIFCNFIRKTVQAFSFSIWKTIFPAKIQIKAQPFFKGRMQSRRNRPVSQNRPVCL